MPNRQDSSSSSRKETDAETSSSSTAKEETSSSSKETETSSSSRKEAETSSTATEETSSSSSRKETETSRKDTPPKETVEDQQTDSDLKLVEHAFYYITEKKYPPECTKNDKRSIRRKAEKLNVVNGELFYKKKDGNEVTVVNKTCIIFVYTCLFCELL